MQTSITSQPIYSQGHPISQQADSQKQQAAESPEACSGLASEE
jgi:hypothetical protein